MLPVAFAGAAKAGLPMAGPPASAYFAWDPSPEGTTTFTSGPSVAGGAATAALVKDAGGDDVGLGVRTAGGCKCVTTVRRLRFVVVSLYAGAHVVCRDCRRWLPVRGSCQASV